ncbi:MAG: hypothetical protein J5496_01885 [Lachnospiraceae bacterium]|nr:hypothetical protein [Lachnospiraceae bacterium]
MKNDKSINPWIRRICAGLALVLLVGGSVWMISRQNRIKPKNEESIGMTEKTDNITAREQTGTTAEMQPESLEDPIPADPAVKAVLLAEPEYPEEWAWNKTSGRKGELPPGFVRRQAGVETADLFRSYFADMMLLLLSEEDQQNAVMSPVNIFMATAMLAEVTGGQTRQEILNAMGVGSLSELRKQAAALWGMCYRDDGQEKLVLGNSLWLSNGLSYRESAVKSLAEHYYASSFRGQMGSEEYDQLLREWLSAMTGDLLKEQAASEHLDPNCVLALAGTIWLQTKWADMNCFDPEQTADAVFHGARGDETVPFMHQESAAWECWCGENYRMVRLSTGQGAAIFFLPDESVSVTEMMASPSFREYLANSNQGTVEGMSVIEAKVNLSVPKLDINATQDLIGSMKKLGMESCFDPKTADFSPLLDLPGTHVDAATQSSRLMMDEEGISAASYVLITAAGYPPEEEIEINMVIDRPFFLLVTGYAAIPLFAAVVNTIEP